MFWPITSFCAGVFFSSFHEALSSRWYSITNKESVWLCPDTPPQFGTIHFLNLWWHLCYIWMSVLDFLLTWYFTVMQNLFEYCFWIRTDTTTPQTLYLTHKHSKLLIQKIAAVECSGFLFCFVFQTLLLHKGKHHLLLVSTHSFSSILLRIEN